jgi:3-deoxy-7-phosphoheptulonate synthase
LASLALQPYAGGAKGFFVISGLSVCDVINREDFTSEARRNNPFNMVEAYHQSAKTLIILRSFSTGGYADISRLHAWNLDFVEQTEEGSR